MARDRFIKTRSNYVIKELHQATNIGNIYERDFMTISDLNSYAPGSLPAYGLNGFKMVVNDGINLKKKHHYGNWVKNEHCDGKPMYWYLQCMDDEGKQLSNASTLKPNLNSVLDFACYGSAYKMIETAVKNIISKYPGELYLTDETIKVDNKTYYLVNNPFNIEMDKTSIIDEKIENPLRVFCDSYDKYLFVNHNGIVGGKALGWDVTFLRSGIYIENGEIKKKCLNNGDRLSQINLGYPFDNGLELLLYYIIYNGEKVLVHDGSYIGATITPNNKVKKEFFNNLKGFEKVLLNKKTNYTAILDTPEETETGNVMYRKAYTWPKSNYGNWNIDVTSNAFYNYFDSLLAIGEFYDSYFSNNIWRSMTHEAIVNFDWTLTKVDSNGVTEEEDTPHSERIQSFIHVAGRMFDDIKQYIDGIANINAITYNECGNKPDVFLNNELENYGWSVKTPLSSKLSRFISDALYPSHSDGYTVEEANYEFFRRLQLNSQAILSAKGTKRAVEMVMALFGYYSLNFLEHSYHEIKRDGKLCMVRWDDLNMEEKRNLLTYSYDMTEYLYVAGEDSSLWTLSNAIEEVKAFNKQKINYDFNNSDEYQGLPLREVTVAVKNPDYAYKVWNEDGTYDIKYIPDYRNYLVPWFDRNEIYDADIYFESKGGWGLKQTTVSQFNDYEDKIIDTSEGLKVYDETVKYLKFVQTIDDLQYIMYKNPKVNDVYYVYDLTGFNQKYNWGYLNKNEDNKQITEPLHTPSHYFVLKDVENMDVFGVLTNTDGKPKLVDEQYVQYNDNGEIINAQSLEHVDDNGFPVKLYGWKNVSEDELINGKSSDAQLIYYLESIIENSEGNNPHAGFGDYDDGNTYKEFFQDIFKGAKDNDNFLDVSDTELSMECIYGFSLDKQIDNIKTWYFTDMLNSEKQLLSLNNDTIIEKGTGKELHVDNGVEITTVGVTNDFVRHTNMRSVDGNGDDELFSSKQYDIMAPYNMEGDDGDDSDEAAANSIINSKQFYIEFIPDISSPEGMYDFIENSIMHYVKQVIPSTTVLKYYVPMTQRDVNCYHRTYIQSAIITE